MSETITLHPRQHDKLGVLHVGVTPGGFIAMAGEPHDIADGETIEISRVPVSVTRKGDDYTFTRLN